MSQNINEKVNRARCEEVFILHVRIYSKWFRLREKRELPCLSTQAAGRSQDRLLTIEIRTQNSSRQRKVKLRRETSIGYDLRKCKLADQGGLLGGHKSTSVKQKHMLLPLPPIFSSPFYYEDLLAGPQLVFTFNNRFSATKRVTVVERPYASWVQIDVRSLLLTSS